MKQWGSLFGFGALLLGFCLGGTNSSRRYFRWSAAFTLLFLLLLQCGADDSIPPPPKHSI